MQTVLLRLRPEDAARTDVIERLAVRRAGMADSDLASCVVCKRSIDARQRNIFIHLTVNLYTHGESLPRAKQINYPVVDAKPVVIVVGAGPSGLFAALRLIELGFRPVVLERGRDVRSRKRDIAQLERSGIVQAESNYCYGEGGAGAFSDGKLYTRSTKRGSVGKILDVFVQHGASPDILIDAHPHIGSDRLPRVIEAMRQTIIASGGQVLFDTKVTELLIDYARKAVLGVRTSADCEYVGSVILATGHSARDMYYYLHSNGVQLEEKGTAIGLRLEHPQALIDSIRYHNPEGRGKYLPPAEYTYSTQSDGRGVYSFCMCPGGFVVPASTSGGEMVVNGMSPALRGSRWANSGLVVELRPEDVHSLKIDAPHLTDLPSPLALLARIEFLEQQAFRVAGHSLHAPSQRMTDFLRRKPSSSLPSSSYRLGLSSALIDDILPPFITDRLRQAFRVFDGQTRGFITEEASLIAIESRTSTPVRIPRHMYTRQHIAYAGLYPVGEGAGYAGGIVSAAIDGERSAEAVAASLMNTN